MAHPPTDTFLIDSMATDEYLMFFSYTNRLFYRFAALIKAMLLLLVCSLCIAAEATDDNLEYRIKAAFLYNFTKFIIWPDYSGATFNICIVGKDPFGNLLDELKTKTALDKPIQLYYYETINQAKDCQIAYLDAIGGKEGGPTSNALTNASLNKTLTVSSQPYFTQQGGMIGMVVENEKVRLHINLKTLKQGGLLASAKLVEIATQVEGAEGVGGTKGGGA